MGDKKILSAEEILSKSDIEEKIIDVPEWGGAVKIRTMSKADQQRLRKAVTVNGGTDSNRFEVMLFVHCVTEPKFTEEQAEALQGKAAVAMDRVISEILTMNGMNKGAQTQAVASFRAGDA